MSFLASCSLQPQHRLALQNQRQHPWGDSPEVHAPVLHHRPAPCLSPPFPSSRTPPWEFIQCDGAPGARCAPSQWPERGALLLRHMFVRAEVHALRMPSYADVRVRFVRARISRARVDRLAARLANTEGSQMLMTVAYVSILSPHLLSSLPAVLCCSMGGRVCENS